jgi:hypothetical protein
MTTPTSEPLYLRRIRARSLLRSVVAKLAKYADLFAGDDLDELNRAAEVIASGAEHYEARRRPPRPRRNPRADRRAILAALTECGELQLEVLRKSLGVTYYVAVRELAVLVQEGRVAERQVPAPGRPSRFFRVAEARSRRPAKQHLRGMRPTDMPRRSSSSAASRNK